MIRAAAFDEVNGQEAGVEKNLHGRVTQEHIPAEVEPEIDDQADRGLNDSQGHHRVEKLGSRVFCPPPDVDVSDLGSVDDPPRYVVTAEDIRLRARGFLISCASPRTI